MRAEKFAGMKRLISSSSLSLSRWFQGILFLQLGELAGEGGSLPTPFDGYLLDDVEEMKMSASIITCEHRQWPE